ncbi:MAG: preprotein translocase subunit SecG [Candidatus Omnitrophica bacterium]|nr:preprotein translocase subunit SecG [Candidatus Omnitrophota bacterium]
MYAVLITIHVIASIFLIAVILLQAGRGGGLTDSFAGSQMQNLFGTKSTSVLTKMTTACAVIFIISCLTLAMFSSRKSRSLVDRVNIPAASQTAETGNAGNVETKEAPPAPLVIPGPEETQESAAEAPIQNP